MTNQYITINGNPLVGSGQNAVVVTGIPSSGQVIETTSATTATWQTISAGGPITLTGDVSGSSDSNTVGAISGSTPILITPATLEWAKATSSPVLSQATPTSDVATNNLTIKSQAPYASASVNTSPGNIVLSLPASVAGGTNGIVEIQDNNTTVVAFGKQTEASAYDCIWLAQSAPDSSNYTIAYNNSVMYVSSNNTLILGGSTGNVVVTANGVQLGSVASQFGGAVGAVGITASGGLPTALTTGGISFYANSQALGVNATNIQFPSFITAPALQQATPTSDVATVSLTIQAQSAYGSASTNTSGANLVLQGGNSTAAGTGVGGTINLSSGLTVVERTIATSTYAIDGYQASDCVIFTNSTSNTVTLTLPAPTAGRQLFIKDKVGKATTHNVIISHHASETIDGSATYTLGTNYDAVCLVSDGTNWAVVGEYNGTVI